MRHWGYNSNSFLIKKGDLLRTVNSNKKTVTGKPVTAFYIKKDALIQGPIMTRIDNNKLAKVNPKRASGTGTPSLGNHSSSNQLTAEEIVEAFTLGWNIGTAADHEFGITDWLAQLWYDGYAPLKL